jgi:hypothetical protein
MIEKTDLCRGTPMNFRSMMYKMASLLGDLSAIERGTYGKRLARKSAYRFNGRIMRNIFR